MSVLIYLNLLKFTVNNLILEFTKKNSRIINNVFSLFSAKIKTSQSIDYICATFMF